MTLTQQLSQLTPLLRSSIRNAKLTPELGYWPARFEDLETLYQWLKSEAGEAYRYPGHHETDVTMSQILKHCDKPSKLVMQLIDPFVTADVRSKWFHTNS